MALSENKLYSSWIDDAYSATTQERKECAEHVLTTLANLNAEGKKLVDSFIDNKEFEKLSIVGYLNYTDLHHAVKGEICNLKFTSPTIASKHKKLPLILLISEAKSPAAKYINIAENRKSLGVTQILSYNDSISRMTREEKQKLYKLCIDGIRTYRKESKKSDNWLSDYLDSGKDFKFTGFSANFPYINVDPKYGDTEAFWIHAWGTPQLLFTHLRLPVMIIVGPSVRLDENVLGERNMLGFTG